MTIEYRRAEYGDFDVEMIVAIDHAIRPDSNESVADHVEWHDSQRRAGYTCDRWLVSVDGTAVGSAYIGQSSVYALPPDVVGIYVAVHPEHQHRGFGRALLERAETTASEWSREKAYSWSDETQPRSIRFLENAGYREIDRGWASSIDLTQVDIEGLNDAIDRANSAGIRIVSVATFSRDHGEWKRQLHDLFARAEADIPGPLPIRTVSFEDFAAQNLGRQLIADGFLVALDGDRPVGLTELRTVGGAPHEIWQNLTGVAEDYRGRGIAVALKSQALIWAIQIGYTLIRTHNNQSNASMLAINDRLGFQRNHATMEYLKNL